VLRPQTKAPYRHLSSMFLDVCFCLRKVVQCVLLLPPSFQCPIGAANWRKISKLEPIIHWHGYCHLSIPDTLYAVKGNYQMNTLILDRFPPFFFDPPATLEYNP